MTGSTRIFLSEGQKLFADVPHNRQHLFGLESWDIRLQGRQKSLIFRTEGGRPTLSAWSQKRQEFVLDFWDFHRPAKSMGALFKDMQSKL